MTLPARVSEISKPLLEVDAEVCQRLPQHVGGMIIIRGVKQTARTFCLTYTVAANFERGCEPDHKV